MRSPLPLCRLIGWVSFALLLCGCAVDLTHPSRPITSQTPAVLQTLTSLPPTLTVEPNNPPIVSPYVDVSVESVEIRIAGTAPSLVELVIRGSLPDQCAYTFYFVENRGDHSIRITLKGIHPRDTTCAQTSQSLETIYPLGQDLPESERALPAGDYELTVNNYRTVFSIAP